MYIQENYFSIISIKFRFFQGAPMFYSPVGNGYPTQGQPPVGPPPFYDHPNHDTPIAQPVTDGKTVVNGKESHSLKVCNMSSKS